MTSPDPFRATMARGDAMLSMQMRQLAETEIRRSWRLTVASVGACIFCLAISWVLWLPGHAPSWFRVVDQSILIVVAMVNVKMLFLQADVRACWRARIAP